MEADAPLSNDRTSPEHGAADDPVGSERERLEHRLAELTLPLMWSLRQEAVRAFEPLDLQPIRVLVLELIARGFTHPKDLAEVLETVPPAVSNMLTELESKGYLRRTPDPEDGRRIRLELTTAGWELLSEVQRRWRSVSRDKLAAVSDDELRLLIGTYTKILGLEGMP